MKRIAFILTALTLSGCMTVTDFRSNMGLGGSSSGGIAPAPSPVTPAAVAPAPVRPVLTAKERLVFAIEGQGCEMNATNVGAVLSDATITREELLQLTPQLQSEGRVAVSGSGAIRVISSNCT